MTENEYTALIYDIAEQLVDMLKIKKYTISTAESCTGGMISTAIVDIPGASWVLNEAHVTYSNDSKMRILGVREKTLDEFGAVSGETAREMVRGAAKIACADCAIAVTGTAGPDGGTKEKPVGTVYAGFFLKGEIQVVRYNFTGNRQEVRRATTCNTLRHMLEWLEKQ